MIFTEGVSAFFPSTSLRDYCSTYKASDSPPWQRRGGRDIKKNAAKPPLKERPGWFVQQPIIWWLEPTTPSAPAKVASRHFITGRSHPSFAKEGSCSPDTLANNPFSPRLHIRPREYGQ
jgi:hypothetical protein